MVSYCNLFRMSRFQRDNPTTRLLMFRSKHRSWTATCLARVIPRNLNKEISFRCEFHLFTFFGILHEFEVTSVGENNSLTAQSAAEI